MSTLQTSASSRLKRLFTPRPPAGRRATLRDLYAFGLVSVFRRHSVLRVWEPLRETPPPDHRHPEEPTH